MNGTRRHTSPDAAGPTDRTRDDRAGHRAGRRPGRRRSLLGAIAGVGHPTRRLSLTALAAGAVAVTAIAAAVAASGSAGSATPGRPADRRGGAGQRRLIAQPGLGLRGPGGDRRRARGGHAAAAGRHAAGAHRRGSQGLPGRGRRLRRPGPPHHLAAVRRQGQLRPGQDGAGQARVGTARDPGRHLPGPVEGGPGLRQRHLQRADAVGRPSSPPAASPSTAAA